MAQTDEWPTRTFKKPPGYNAPPGAPPPSHNYSKATSNVIVGKPIPPPLTVRYTWDSDDDSGIGHSRGGHGGSTSSSTEAETHELSCAQQPPMTIAKWRWHPAPQISADQQRTSADQQRTSADQQRTSADQQRTSADQLRTSADQLRTSADQQRISADQLRTSADDEQRRHRWKIDQQNRNSAENRSRCDTKPNGGHDERFRPHSKNVFHNTELVPRRLATSFQPLTNAERQLRSGVNERSVGQPNKYDIRRVWSYSGESSMLTNGQIRKPMCNGGGAMMKVNNPIASGTNRSFRSVANEEKCSPHLARNQNYNWSGDGGGLSRTYSASLASLVTVDNVMIHAHACLAAVIPASEVGDTLSVIDVDDEEEETFKSDSISSISSPLPPPPPPPWSIPSAHQTNLYSNCHHRIATIQHTPIGSNYANGHQPYVATCDIATDNRHGLQNELRPIEVDVSYAAISKPSYASAGSKATYATVNKTISKIDVKRNPCSTLQELDETEPPLPPRNYRSELPNKRLTTSKTSLSTKVNGLTRSAKQALRKAFSLEGLNCVADPHNDTQEWDNTEDWVHILALNKPNTPSAVKARNAIRDKSKIPQRQQMATLC